MGLMFTACLPAAPALREGGKLIGKSLHNRLDVHRLIAIRASLDVIRYLLLDLQSPGLVAAPAHGKIGEQIFPAAIGCDEPEAFRLVDPFNSARRPDCIRGHGSISPKNENEGYAPSLLRTIDSLTLPVLWPLLSDGRRPRREPSRLGRKVSDLASLALAVQQVGNLRDGAMSCSASNHDIFPVSGPFRTTPVVPWGPLQLIARDGAKTPYRFRQIDETVAPEFL